MACAVDRRALLRWSAAAALAPLLATRGLAASPRPEVAFAPPTGPMRFTRRLERNLSDGAKLVVSRGFAIRFAPTAGGYTISGEQIAVSVEAPEWIASLADLERQRVETGLFPLSLDRHGMILDSPAARPGPELDEAVEIVMRRLDGGSFTADERRRLDAFVRAVHEAGARMASTMPEDLFAPRDLANSVRRAVALPTGEEGAIAITFTAVTDPTTGMMCEARRDVVTTIAGDSRLTREDWTLGPL